MALSTRKQQELATNIEAVICFIDIVEELVDAIANTCTPEEVFSVETLAEWAEENGYVKAE